MKKTFVIKNELGLHARAAAKFVEVTNKFESEIIVTIADCTFDGKSIMGLLSIGIKKGDEIDVAISGSDENDAFIAIKKLLDEDLINM